MKCLSLILGIVGSISAFAAPTFFEHGLSVTGGPIVDNGETNATQPWVRSQLLDATGEVAQATAGRFAPITSPTLVWTMNPTGTWYDAGGGVSTNADGWATTATPATNGLLFEDFDETDYLLAPVSTSGLASVVMGIATQMHLMFWSVAEDGGATLDEGFYTGAQTISAAALVSTSARARIVFSSILAPPESTNMVLLNRAEISGWTTPEYVGRTNDLSAMHVLIRDATSPDEPASYRQMTDAVHAVQISAGGSAWANHPAIKPVDLAGQPLRWDSQYSSQVITGALTFAWNDNPIVRMIAGSYLATTNPSILSAAIVGTQITMQVVASTGWRPYPEWSVDFETWTRLQTNEFESSFPVQSNGSYRLSFGLQYSNAYYRVWSTNESGGSVTSSYEVLSDVFLHRGVPVATVDDLPVAFGSPTSTQHDISFTNGASVNFAGAGSLGGVRLYETGAVSAPSRAISFFIRDALGVQYEGKFRMNPDGRMNLNLFGFDYEVFSSLHNSFLSVTTFQGWSTNAVKYVPGSPGSPGAPGPVGMVTQIRSVGTNVYFWLPDLANWGKQTPTGITTNWSEP